MPQLPTTLASLVSSGPRSLLRQSGCSITRRSLRPQSCAAPGRTTPHRLFHLQALSRARPSGNQNGISRVRNYQTDKQGARKWRHREVMTLHPDRLASVGQPILDLKDVTRPSFSHGKTSIRLEYFRKDCCRSPFPVGTKGVLYFHHVAGDDAQSQLRFRLCDTLDGFGQGKDLLSPSGNPWGVSLKVMKRNPDHYSHVVFALLKQEFTVDIPRDLNTARFSRRKISTLDPGKLPFSKDTVINMSGFMRPIVTLSGVEEVSTAMPPFLVDDKLPGCAVPYPPGTTGVYYYKQSTVSPTRLGELRFRICASVEEFEQGTDLRLPSGLVWHLGSVAICASRTVYTGMYNFLKAEGLLEGHPHPTLAHGRYPLSLKTPFVLELSFRRHVLCYTQDGEPQTNIALMNLFRRKPDTPLFSGRVIVQFEEYPWRKSSGDGPLLAVRILEHMTPIKTLTEDDYIQLPTPGELLRVREHRNGTGNYVPYGYNPRKDVYRQLILGLFAQQGAEKDIGGRAD